MSDEDRAFEELAALLRLDADASEAKAAGELKAAALASLVSLLEQHEPDISVHRDQGESNVAHVSIVWPFRPGRTPIAGELKLRLGKA